MSGAADRRRFIKSAGAFAALAVLRPRLASAGGKPRMAIAYSALPAGLTPLERFRLAVDAGFLAAEMPAIESLSEAEGVGLAAEQAGIRIHCVTDTLWQRRPLCSADPVVVRQGVASITTSLRNARLWGAAAVSIVPASARNTSYQEAWNRSQQVLSERVLPTARETGVVIAIERVWDGFLLGPSEVARYVDAFDSPWVKAAFDTTNAPFYTRPRDWIRTLGPRLANVRVDSPSVDFTELRRALDDIDYAGWLTHGSSEGTVVRRRW